MRLIWSRSAQKLAILLERHQRRELENQLGMQLKITNISTVRDSIILTKTKIYYRSNYLDALALQKPFRENRSWKKCLWIAVVVWV